MRHAAAEWPRLSNSKKSPSVWGRQTGGSPRPDSSRAFSDNIHFWNEGTLLLKPAFPWELVQMGNGGSPIETDAGWLVLSHGVGPMRKYCIGAFFLDRDDPAKVIGRLREPLLKPNRNERRRVRPHPQPPRLHGARPHPLVKTPVHTIISGGGKI
jgi:hypothetical protein